MRKEDFFRTLENIDDNYISEAENYKAPKISSKLITYIGIAASLLMVAGVIGLALYMNNNSAVIEMSDVETQLVPTNVGIDPTGAVSTSNETFKDPTDKMSMIHAVGTDIPEDTVVVYLRLSSSAYLNGEMGWYAPENQDEWKKAIDDAVSRAQDKEGALPAADSVPISVSWFHKGYWDNNGGSDYWELAKDGSLWGYREPNDVPFSKHYIAPEDAKELVALLRQVYDFFGINPIGPEEITDITSAELTVKGKTYTLDDKTKLDYLEKTLRNAKPNGASGCPWATLKMTKKDGTVITISLACDSCAVWNSDGMHYKYGNSDTTESVYALFGIDLSKLHMSN